MVAQWQAAGVFAAQAGMYKPKKDITTAWRAVPTRQLNLAAFPCAHQPRAWEATACVLAKIEVPKDMDCLVHALAFPDGGDGTALRAEVAAFMQSDAHKQIGSEEAWRREGRKLLQGTWGGRMAIAAFSLLRRVKVEVHVHQPSGNVAIMDATQGANRPGRAAAAHLLQRQRASLRSATGTGPRLGAAHRPAADRLHALRLRLPRPSRLLRQLSKRISAAQRLS